MNAIDLAPPHASRTPAPGARHRVVVTSDLESLTHLWPSATAPGTALFHVFQSAEILRAWTDTIGAARGVQPCFCAVLDGKDAPLMLLPFGIEVRRGTRVLTFLDGGVSDYNTPILFPQTPSWDAEQAREVINDVFTALPPFDIAILEKLLPDVRGRPNPLLHLGARTWPCGAHAAHLTGNWEAFSQERIRHSKRFARYVRQLQKNAPLSYVEADAETFAPHLEKLFAQKEERFAETRVPGFTEQPGMKDFYRCVTERFVGSGLVHLAALMSGDQTIAAQWGLRMGQHYYYLICGFEGGEWEKFSPGRLVTEAMLKWCYDQDLEVADFGIGDEPYKLEYCDQSLELHYVVKPVTVRGHIYAASQQTLEWLRATKAWQRLRPYKWVVLRALRSKSGTS